jgi:hypothetical protein
MYAYYILTKEKHLANDSATAISSITNKLSEILGK